MTFFAATKGQYPPYSNSFYAPKVRKRHETSDGKWSQKGNTEEQKVPETSLKLQRRVNSSHASAVFECGCPRARANSTAAVGAVGAVGVVGHPAASQRPENRALSELGCVYTCNNSERCPNDCCLR